MSTNKGITAIVGVALGIWMLSQSFEGVFGQSNYGNGRGGLNCGTDEPYQACKLRVQHEGVQRALDHSYQLSPFEESVFELFEEIDKHLKEPLPTIGPGTDPSVNPNQNPYVAPWGGANAYYYEQWDRMYNSRRRPDPIDRMYHNRTRKMR